ncbi:MAG: hypothetical protein HOW73_02195 [Polyangiaceae bacterium]|nr:hypothetical protein [Polyangiaceae bacterium]
MISTATIHYLPLPGTLPVSSRIERDLARIVRGIREAAGEALEAILLVGGYGRGEGGELGDGPEAAAHNDYDLVAVCSSVSRRLRHAIERASVALGSEIGVDVDVHPVPRALVAFPPATLFWLDVSLGGARVLDGDADVLRTMRAVRTRDVPLEEGARLLANRATGIAISRLRGARTSPLETARHVHKAVLACGDVRLLAADRYRLRVGDRAADLARLAHAGAAPRSLAEAYAEAAAFRARPDRWTGPADIEGWLERSKDEIARWHLEFESYRFSERVDLDGYLERRSPLYPRSADTLPIGAPAAVRAAVRRQASLRPYFGHPREKLARVAIALAYLPLSRAVAVARELMALPRDASAGLVLDALSSLRGVGA